MEGSQHYVGALQQVRGDTSPFHDFVHLALLAPRREIDRADTEQHGIAFHGTAFLAVTSLTDMQFGGLQFDLSFDFAHCCLNLLVTTSGVMMCGIGSGADVSVLRQLSLNSRYFLFVFGFHNCALLHIV